MSFIDRPFFADSVLSPSRESGAAFQVNDKDYRWLLSTSFTSGQLDGGETDVDDADTFSVRGSFVPFMQDDKHLLQVGAGIANVQSVILLQSVLSTLALKAMTVQKHLQ